ncbi:type IV secretion system protein VirB10 [Stenoxybacter acetivorans]|uniref:type IV secretion system protein VirB10 n=1 Tax=Stenoxybacter acetivorans TaxID=422441 RepID=UPI000566AA6B|nr:type IV secretion system protein VirB10 [Stenoxybacter acetivorans]
MAFFKKKQDKGDFSQIATPSMADKVEDNTIEAGLPLNADSGKKSNMGKVGLAAGGLLAVMLIVGGLIMMTSGKDNTEEETAKPVAEAVRNTQPKDFSQDKVELASTDLDFGATSEPTTDNEAVPSDEMMPNHAQAQPEATASAPIDENRLRRLGGEVVLPLAERSNTTAGNDTEGSNQHVADSSGFGNSSGSTGFSGKLNPTATPTVRAMQRGNRDLLLAKGTNIQCVLETRIITTQPGFTRCQISRDIYSANGKVLLLERGSKIIGEQTSALVQGQARVFVLWNEIETPHGVKINIASPGSGALGEGGHEAKINYHFWQRFGGAILISLINDVAENLTQRQQGMNGNNNSITYENSSEAAQEMATEALKNSINIPPTGTVNQGAVLNIMAARDVDFSGVYELVPNPWVF